jgi:hypothetical protein
VPSEISEMAPPAASLFGYFDLKNANSLRRLAIALEYWLANGRDRENTALSSLSPLQEGNIEYAVQQMQVSPLLMEVVTPLINAPRTGNAGLLAAGRDIEAYVAAAIGENSTAGGTSVGQQAERTTHGGRGRTARGRAENVVSYPRI